jgi:aspartate-semialdehyde dehydrogenase
MVVALKPLHDAATIKSIRVATYQSVSGAGGRGIADLEAQSRSWAQNKPIPSPKKIPHQIAFNLVPQIDVFMDNGYTKEEMKMVGETRKIMGAPKMAVSATCVRVPVFRSHSESVWIETKRPLSVQKAQALLRKAPGIKLVDQPEKGLYPMPLHAEGQSITYVGRVRKDLVTPNGLILWVVSDNLLKGAALNAVEIAELLVKRGKL